MLRFAFTVICIVPFAGLMANALGTDTQGIPEYTYPSYADIQETRLDTLKDCQSTKVTIDFHEDNIMQHSLEYLMDAAQAVEKCDLKIIEVEAFHPRNATAAYQDLSDNRFNQVKDVLDGFNYDVLAFENRDLVNWDEEIVKDKRMSVEFKFEHNI